MKYYVLQSPKPGKRQSEPIPASETARIAHLESMGWRVIETRDDGAEEPTPEPEVPAKERRPRKADQASEPETPAKESGASESETPQGGEPETPAE